MVARELTWQPSPKTSPSDSQSGFSPPHPKPGLGLTAHAPATPPLALTPTFPMEGVFLLTSDPAAAQLMRLLLGLAIQKVDTALRGEGGWKGITQTAPSSAPHHVAMPGTRYHAGGPHIRD